MVLDQKPLSMTGREKQHLLEDGPLLLSQSYGFFSMALRKHLYGVKRTGTLLKSMIATGCQYAHCVAFG